MLGTQVFATWLPKVTATDLSSAHSSSGLSATFDVTQTGHLLVLAVGL